MGGLFSASLKMKVLVQSLNNDCTVSFYLLSPQLAAKDINSIVIIITIIMS